MSEIRFRQIRDIKAVAEYRYREKIQDAFEIGEVPKSGEKKFPYVTEFFVVALPLW